MGVTPSYEEREFSDAERLNRLRVIASPDGRDGSVTIGQDAAIYDAVLEPGAEVEHAIAPGRGIWIQMAKGSAGLNGLVLEEGDGAAVTDEASVRLTAHGPAEVLLFDLK
jgi:redox-sensitive bicupin YhaK (pirin superfamily)